MRQISYGVAALLAIAANPALAQQAQFTIVVPQNGTQVYPVQGPVQGPVYSQPAYQYQQPVYREVRQDNTPYIVANVFRLLADGAEMYGYYSSDGYYNQNYYRGSPDFNRMGGIGAYSYAPGRPYNADWGVVTARF